MNLLELQNVLGERIRLHANGIAKDDVDEEIETSSMIAKLAKQTINASDVILRGVKLIAEKETLCEEIYEVIGVEKEDSATTT